MLKFIFICLLIANALVFSLWRGYFINPLAESHQPERLAQQKNTAQIKLVSADVATVPPPAPAPAPVPIAVSAPAPAPKMAETTMCMELGLFQPSELTKVESKLSTLSFGNRQIRQNARDLTTSMIFIPPLASKEAADKKASELIHLGVHDFFIIQDQSDLRWGISLGVFKSEEAAKQVLATLASKGVRSARLGTRPMRDKFKYVFKNVTSAEKTGLDKLAADFPGQELRVCK